MLLRLRILLPIALDMILRKGMVSSGWLAPKGGAGTPVALVLPLLDGVVPPTMCYEAPLLIDNLSLTLTFHYKLWGMTGLQAESLWWVGDGRRVLASQ